MKLNTRFCSEMIMRKIFIFLILGSLALLFIGCEGNGVESANANTDVGENVNSVKNANGNANKAEEKEVVIEDITSAETALEEGNKYFDRSQNVKAIEAYKKATELDEDLAEAHFKLGIAYAIKESEEELNPVALDAANSAKRDAKKKLNSEQAFENAVTAYKKIVKKDKKDAQAFFNLGRSYNKLDDDKEARKALEQAIKIEPEDSQYQTEYGAIMIKFAKYDLAIRALKKAIKLDEANSQAEELLKVAEAGKKRVDFGAEKLKEKAGKE